MQNNINVTLAKEKGLIIDDNDEKYNKIKKIYKLIFSKYLLSKIDLKKYDDEIFNSNLDFGLMPDSNKIIYQKESYLNLRYIYIRNNFYVEKLSLEQINYLNNLDIDNINLDEKLLSIIETTFKEIICDNYRNDKYISNTHTCYGAFVPSNIVDANALTLCIQYGKNNNEYEDREYLENSKLKKAFLSSIAETLKLDIIDNLNINCTVLIRNFVGEN